eukprot:9222721-Pyramimonas_sp.AAC.1
MGGTVSTSVVRAAPDRGLGGQGAGRRPHLHCWGVARRDAPGRPGLDEVRPAEAEGRARRHEPGHH